MSTDEVTTNAAAQSAHAVGTNTVTNTGSSQGIFDTFWGSTHHAVHILVIIGMAFAVHVIVRFIRFFSELVITKSHEKQNPLGFVTHQPKFITLARLIVSTITFAVYAVAIYVILKVEFPNDSTLKTYLGSAAVVGLALSFGLQGLVQDVVTGITLILSDAMDVGDTVDLMNGVIGRVERIGLRFTKVINFYNQEIFVPNRNIINVSRFPHGGILAYADILIPPKADQNAVAETIQNVSKGVWTQFAAIVLSEPVFSKIRSTPGNWNYLRIMFKIWPGQNSVIENALRAQMVNAMKAIDPTYSDWQVVVTYRAMND
ncbi:MAG TPA: mechanosensitive ion channel domain-containing protein [Verrucomicrobiae bacterium]|jgi:small conductance mechanosensitive channel|nr:mechanosensitive ion channel domain-containing protein [Verrucomicrobiae bacterium]